MPSYTAVITRTITLTTQKERILLVELLHAKYAHVHSTNGMRSLSVIIVIVLVIAAVGPGLKTIVQWILSTLVCMLYAHDRKLKTPNNLKSAIRYCRLTI